MPSPVGTALRTRRGRFGECDLLAAVKKEKRKMKSIIGVLLIGMMAVSCGQAASQVYDAKTVKSDILGKAMKYAVYLPDGYSASERSYPVLYLLHGYSDDQTGWVQFGEVQRIADRMIAEGRAAPMIIVMPDAEVSWYCLLYTSPSPRD